MNRAVIYIRVSTKDQVENFSLGTQERACREYCTKHSFAVDKVFTEGGESAKTTDRTRFKEMLAYCHENKGRVKWLVVYAVNRFARNAHDHLATRAFLGNLGVSLRSVTETFDESSQGKFMESIMAAVAQLDNDVRAERTVDGMKAALQSGRWPFKAPLGFINETKPESPSLIIDAERGPLVRQAFELCGTGLHTTQKVLEIVTAAGLRTWNGKPVAKQTFSQILRKPVYAGWMVVQGWGERVKGDFEPLVSQELFDRVQAILSGKRPSVMPRLRSNPDFPLRHFVKCGCCGRPLTASWSKGRSKKYAFYRCPAKHVNLSKLDLESAFVAYLQQLQPKPEYVKLFNAVVLDAWKEKQAQNLALTTSLKHRLEELVEKKDKLTEARLYRQEIDQATYQRFSEKLDREILLAEMAERDAKLEEYDVGSVLNFAEHVILNASRLWTEASSDQKQRLQKVFFPEGVRFSNGGFGTAVTCLFFNLLQGTDAEKSGVATLTVSNWNQLTASLRELSLLREAGISSNVRPFSKGLRPAVSVEAAHSQ